jgi:hypothetical protein
VNIFLENVEPDQRYNFDKHTTDVDMLDTAYDLMSVMHYGNTEFSMNGNDTIVAKDGTPLLQAWQKTDISDTDVEAIRRYYGCID